MGSRWHFTRPHCRACSLGGHGAKTTLLEQVPTSNVTSIKSLRTLIGNHSCGNMGRKSICMGATLHVDGDGQGPEVWEALAGLTAMRQWASWWQRRHIAAG